MSIDKQELLFNHAWRYFELHANQRISLIRYYIALYSLYISGSGFIIARPSQNDLFNTEGIIIPLSLIFLGVTLVFYILDRRNRELVHLAEASLVLQESDLGLQEPYNIFTIEQRNAFKKNVLRSSDCFNALFLLGVITAVVLIAVKI